MPMNFLSKMAMKLIIKMLFLACTIIKVSCEISIPSSVLQASQYHFVPNGSYL